VTTDAELDAKLARLGARVAARSSAGPSTLGPCGRNVIGPAVQVEAWIARRLREPTLFDGITTPDERRERVRALIERKQMHLAIAGKREGEKCETWVDLFERVYQQPFSQEQQP
jgi:hypothetical protein